VKGTARRLKQRLRRVGLSDSIIDAAWPEWWSQAADASVSAQAELRFSLARKLGLDPHSLLDDDAEPRFIWRDEAQFKHFSGKNQLERAAITSFGTAVGRYLIEASSVTIPLPNWDSMSLRNAILRERPYVALVDILSACWALGVPVVHLRIFPRARKRMSAMAVRVGGRAAIMLGKDSMYPPHIAFYLAHELAHIALGHLDQEPVIVDFDTTVLATSSDDPEEIGADRFALELLTGMSQPKVLPKFTKYNARELARVALEAAPELSIEPGTLALCFGYSTGDWPTANAAIRRIYPRPRPVWAEVNKIAASQLALELVPDDSMAYLKSILGDVWKA
jgi:hypothetical protein